MITVGPDEMLAGDLLLLWSQLGLPLEVPPEPEDKWLAQVAPRDCLVYFASSGRADLDRTSANRTERLLAEPDVRPLLGPLAWRPPDALTAGPSARVEAPGVHLLTSVKKRPRGTGGFSIAQD